MKTLIVNINENCDIQAIADAMRLLRGVENVSVSETEMRRMSMDEYREMAEQAIVEEQEGRTISQAEMEKRVASWR